MQVLADICDAFTSASVRYWVIGGYGVELIVGQPLRPHDDIDFFISLPHITRAVQVLRSMGFSEHAGSVEEGDVFFRRDDVIVDLVPIDDPCSPPLTTGDLEMVAWHEKLFVPQEVPYKEVPCVTLTAEMHLEMKRTVAEFFGVTPREKDLLDIEVLERLRDGLG